MTLRTVWQQLTKPRPTRAQILSERIEAALRIEFADRVRTLEAQILLLRAENRGLLNSVLGIAGVPPIIVDDPCAATVEGAFSAVALGDARHPGGAALPATSGGSIANIEEGKDQPARAKTGSAGPQQKQAGRARDANDPRIIAPMRRRSWHQIYRKLEFESSRQKDRDQ